MEQPAEASPQLPRKLLIVDDEEKICRLFAEHFAFRGYDVKTVHRGEDALAMTHTFHPDVVLLDCIMPGIGGIETLKGLKQLTPPPKVLMVSAADHEDAVKSALAHGADCYVYKPVDLSNLDQLLHTHCPPGPL